MDVVSLEATVSLVAAAASLGQFFIKRQRDDTRQIIRDEVEEAIKPVTASIFEIDKKLAVIDDRVKVLWKDVSFNAARVLHHPEPSRKRVDDLLDKFLTGELAEGEKEELKGYLVSIRDWNPGQPAPFRMFHGEQVAAAILLSTIDHVDMQPRKGKK